MEIVWRCQFVDGDPELIRFSAQVKDGDDTLTLTVSGENVERGVPPYEVD